MSVILAANYRQSANPTVSVPAPPDGKGDPWWYDRIAQQAHQFRGKIQNFLFNPHHITIGGSSATSDGYGVLCRYNSGKPGHESRFGHDYLFQRVCSIGYRNGIRPMMDWVPHQNYGGRNQSYHFDAWGGKGMLRYPLEPSCFRKVAGEDSDIPDKFWDIEFGDELEQKNGYLAENKHYVRDYLKDAARWNMLRYGLQAGGRDDDMKGQSLSGVREWLQTGVMRNALWIGEYAEGNKDVLRWYLDQMPQNMYLFDFEIKYMWRDICNSGGGYDMSQIAHKGLASLGAQYAARSVTFVENPDSDTNGFGAVVWNKKLAYAGILFMEGWPSIYYRDWSHDKNCYGVDVNNLIWCHQRFANGSTEWLKLAKKYVIGKRNGYLEKPGCIFGLNNDVWNNQWTRVVIQTGRPYTTYHDYTGHCQDQRSDAHGDMEVWLPPANNGNGYFCYAELEHGGDLPYESMRTTQTFEGSSDLIEGPATRSGTEVTQLWPEKQQTIRLRKTQGDGVRFVLLGPDGETVIAKGDWEGEAKQQGWHQLLAYHPDAATPYQVEVNYLGTETI